MLPHLFCACLHTLVGIESNARILARLADDLLVSGSCSKCMIELCQVCSKQGPCQATCAAAATCHVSFMQSHASHTAHGVVQLHCCPQEVPSIHAEIERCASWLAEYVGYGSRKEASVRLSDCRRSYAHVSRVLRTEQAIVKAPSRE